MTLGSGGNRGQSQEEGHRLQVQYDGGRRSRSLGGRGSCMVGGGRGVEGHWAGEGDSSGDRADMCQIK